MEIAPLNNEVAESDDVGAAYWINTEDKVRLRVGMWCDERAVNGTILFFTGRAEFIEKYGRTLPSFLEQGFAIFSIDWRGQGLSDRVASDAHLGHVLHFSDYQKNVVAMIEAARSLNLPKPWFLFGHSMGGNIGLRSLIDGIPVVASAFTAPMWSIAVPSFLESLAKPLSRLAVMAGLGEMYTKSQKGNSYALYRSFESNSITNDRPMYEYFIRQATLFPEAHIGAPSMRWLYEGLTECDRLSSLRSPEVPCSAFVGKDDATVGRRSIEDRMSSWRDGAFTIVNDAKHDLLCDRPNISKVVIQDICAVFRQYVP